MKRAALVLALALALSSLILPFGAGAASRHSTKVICITSFQPPRGSYRFRPHACTLHERHQFPINASNVANLRHLHWFSWGERARARGKIAFNMVGYKSVKVQLYARRTLCDHTVYTRARLDFRLNGKRHRGRFRIDTCLR